MSAAITEITDEAEILLDAFIERHHSAAIPSLIGACVLWAVQNGGGDLIRQTLANLSQMSVEMEAELRKAAQ
jgi:hypothetical protein